MNGFLVGVEDKATWQIIQERLGIQAGTKQPAKIVLNKFCTAVDSPTRSNNFKLPAVGQDSLN